MNRIEHNRGEEWRDGHPRLTNLPLKNGGFDNVSLKLYMV